MLSLILTLACTLAPSQQGEPSVLGAARTPGDKPLAAAQLWFVPAAHSGYRWLDPALRQPSRNVGKTGERGNFRFASPVSGQLLITGKPQVGALCHCSPGIPVFPQTQPLAEIKFSGGRKMSGFIRAILSATDFVPLPAIEARTSIRLPAGQYHLLLRQGESYVEYSIALESGRSLELPESDRPAIHIDLEGLNMESVWLEGWPRAQFKTTATGRLTIIPFADELSLLGSRDEDGIHAEYALPIQLGRQGIQRPLLDPRETITVTVHDQEGRPLEGVSVHSIERRGGRSYRRSQAKTKADGACQLRVSSSKAAASKSFIVAWKQGLSFQQAAVHRARSKGLVLRPGSLCSLRVTDASGTGIAGAVLKLSPDSELPRIFRTDGRGQTQIHMVSARQRLEVSAPGFLRQIVELSPLTKPYRNQVITVAKGLKIMGRVFDPQGKPAAGILVEVRDPSGQLITETRSTSTSREGRFDFTGLPDGLYTVFASAERDGTTWSARLRNVQPETGDWSLNLASEDPPLPGKKKPGKKK